MEIPIVGGLSPIQPPDGGAPPEGGGGGGSPMPMLGKVMEGLGKAFGGGG